MVCEDIYPEWENVMLAQSIVVDRAENGFIVTLRSYDTTVQHIAKTVGEVYDIIQKVEWRTSDGQRPGSSPPDGVGIPSFLARG